MSLGRYLLLVFAFNAFALGNGPVMVSLFQRGLVDNLRLLSTDELLYSFAIAQATPGQNNLYVASIGYLLYGMLGAVLALVVLVAPGYLVLPLVHGRERFGKNVHVRRLIRGMTAASLGLILAAAVTIGEHCLTQPAAWVAFLLTLVLTQFLRWNELVGFATACAAAAVFRVC